MVAPCKDCADRHVGCHATCKAYIAYAVERERYRQDKAKEGVMYGSQRVYRAMRKRVLQEKGGHKP